MNSGNQPFGLRRALVLAFLICCAVGMPLAAQAQASSYPNRAVRIVVPAAAGGALDTIARLLAQKVSSDWKQPVYIENRPGANFMIGMDAVAKSPPDGYTLLLVASAGITINPYAFPNVTLEPLRDLAPVVITSSGTFVLLVNDSVSAKTIEEFVAHLKANPGKLNHGSNSASTILVSELFKSIANVDYVDVNYRGASEAIVATQSGVTQFCFVDAGSAASALQGSALRPLALTTRQRSKLMPDIPTFAEKGMTSLVASTDTLLMVSAKTPVSIIDQINAGFQRAMQSPDVIKAFATIANEVGGQSKDEAYQMLSAAGQQWQKVIKERGIKFRQ